jgi:hypothetical protein
VILQVAGIGQIVCAETEPSQRRVKSWIASRRLDIVTVMAPVRRPLRFLFAMFQGGGNIPLILPIVSELEPK